MCRPTLPRRLFRVTATVVGMSLALTASPGCKRRREAQAPDVIDDAPTSAQAEALGTLTPPWQASAPQRLDNGAMWSWLHEPGSPAFHLRLMLPTHAASDGAATAAYAVAAEHLRAAVATAVRRLAARVELVHKATRVELVVHSQDAHAEAVLAALARVLGRTPPGALARAQTVVAQQLEQPWAEAVATAAVVADVLDRHPQADKLARDNVMALRPEALEATWKQLVDPRQAVLTVHAGRPAAALGADMNALSEAWEAAGLLGRKRSILERLRNDGALPEERGRLQSEAPPPLWHDPTAVRGGPVLVLGRSIAVDSLQSRGMARLAQRLAQEELDARLSISGNKALFIVVVPLEGDPAERVAEVLSKLRALSQRRHETQRMFQAVQLWLGARVVATSLQGEDWTALWSEAIDLAENDDDIAQALRRDAKIMLATSPAALQEWQRRWLDPAQPGWSWAVAGLPDGTSAIGRMAPLKPWPPKR